MANFDDLVVEIVESAKAGWAKIKDKILLLGRIKEEKTFLKKFC
jgi:hypothetical protein